MDWKTRLKKVTLPHVNSKSQKRKRIFVQTPFSHSTSSRVIKVHDAKPLAFPLHFLFQRDQYHHFDSTSKLMKIWEKILKKRQNTI